MSAVVILAGGKGTRMGGNKPLHPYGDTTLIEATLMRLKPQVSDIVINAGIKGSLIALSLEKLGLPLIFDDEAYAGRGPLSGVLTAMRYAGMQGLGTVVTSPCDMPNLPTDMIERLLQSQPADIVHFKGKDDYPLCALWQISLRPGLEAVLAMAAPDKGLSVMRYQSAQVVHKLWTDDDYAFRNVNSLSTPEARDGE